MKQISEKIEHWFSQELPFCVYRKPYSQIVNGVFQSDDSLHTTTEFNEKGFVFAPFDFSRKAVLLSPDEVLKATYDKEENNDLAFVPNQEAGKAFHLKLVENGLQAIRFGNLKKIVLSRKIEVETSKPPLQIFWGLVQRYENAFCYLFYHPKVGTWCGATPETLVSIQGKHLTTVSLAGTLPVNQDAHPQWTEKEKDEQRLVTDYIIQQLSSKLNSLKVGELQTIKAGKLWHLKTTISAELPNDVNVAEIVSLIHPTPAVCGIPTKESLRLIVGNEGYDRNFYTGFLGELNLDSSQEVSFFVNLRCMELLEGTARIFVGGGITSDSIPENEWEETQSKSQTMLSLL